MSDRTLTSPRRRKIAPGVFERVGPRGPRYSVLVRRDGSQNYQSLQARNRTEAKAEALEVLKKFKTGSVSSFGDRSITLQAAVDSYLAYERSPLTARTRASSVTQRESLLRRHVLTVLKPSTRVVDLEVTHVRRMVDACKRKQLSGSTVRCVVSALSSVLDHAARQGWVGRNVTKDLVRGDLPSGEREKPPRYLDPAEAQRLFEALPEETRPLAQTLYYAALRLGEGLSLRWADVSFDTGRIFIRSGKTKASVADVPLLGPLAAILREHRERQAARGFDRIAPDLLVFQTLSGKLLDDANVYRAISSAAERAGLNRTDCAPVGPHALRHSAAAAAFAAGLNIVEVSRLMRHKDPSITLRTYSAIAGDAVPVLAKKLADAFAGASS